MCHATHLAQKEQSAGTLASEFITQPLSVMKGGTMQLQFLVGRRTGGVRRGEGRERDGGGEG